MTSKKANRKTQALLDKVESHEAAGHEADKDIRPPIWRRVRVGSHRHEFKIGANSHGQRSGWAGNGMGAMRSSDLATVKALRSKGERRP